MSHILQALLGQIAPTLQQLRQTGMDTATPAGAGTCNRAAADPYMFGVGQALNFGGDAKLVVGIISDTAAHYGCYRVQFDRMVAPKVCVLASDTTTSAFGVRDAVTLQPGTGVLVLISDANTIGIIMAALPVLGTTNTLLLPDQISQATRTRKDDAHMIPATMRDGGGIEDYLAGRPLDQTTAGEWCKIAATGVRLFLDDYMLQAAVDETTGFFAFYHNQLTRVAGHNLEELTAGFSRLAYDDQGEYSEVLGWTPYPWENLGRLARGNPFTSNPSSLWQKGDGNAAKEPADPKQWPFHRMREYRGYLAQGSLRQLVAPPPGATTNTLGSRQPAVGLFTETLDAAGRLSVASARGLSFTKTPHLVVPLPQHRPQSPEGDTDENYKVAGAIGTGPDHPGPAGLAAEGEFPAVQRVAGIDDLRAWIQNFSSLQAFLAHQRDWHCPEAAAQPHWGAAAAVPNFAQLASQPFLDLPPSAEINVDHRDGMQGVKYYLSECGYELTDDGSIVVFDGYGFAIRSLAGSGEMSAPGDLHIRAGRNVIIWAGNDLIARAKNAMELSTSEGSTWIKSQQGLHMLAGNGGSGGVLIESRGAGDSQVAGLVGDDVSIGGVAIRATNGNLALYGQTAYLRGEQVTVVDGAGGESPVVINSSQFQVFATTSASIGFGTGGDVKDVVVFGPDSAAIGTQLHVNGSAVISGQLVATTGVLVTEGHIATSRAESANFMVAPLQDEPLEKARQSVDEVEDQTTSTIPQRLSGAYSQLSSRVYDSGKVGDATTIGSTEFSFRSDAQLSPSVTKIMESRWQQLARTTGSGQTWQERPVVCRADPESYPFPGKTAFTQDGLIQQDLQLFDPTQGPKPRDAAEYDNPTYGEQRTLPLTDYFIVGASA